MLFRVQNLGPLREAEVDLSKDIIVLAGPNNSGKTYLAWSVYGLHRMRPVPKVDLSRWVKQLIESPDHSLDMSEFVAAESDRLSEAFARRCTDDLHRCFAAEESRFAGANIEIRQLDLNRVAYEMAGMLYYHRESERGGMLAMHHGRLTWTFRQDLEDLKSFLITALDHTNEARLSTTTSVNAFSPEVRGEIESEIGIQLVELLRAHLLRLCTLFPAERIAINIFAKELALARTTLVDEMVDADIDGRLEASMDLVRQNAGRYPWPIRDSLRTANDLANLKKRKSPFVDLADELESLVLRGSVSVADAGELRFAPNDRKDAQLEMHLTASVVKSLSSLVFYFRHLANPRDFIIIDEPELNLHPDNQRIITRILAKAARRGIKIMMSTHSDYVLRELNHLIMLSKLPEDEAKAMGYDPLWAIAPDRIGVYLFDEHTAKPVPIEETGFSIKTIDDVVDRLNADEQRLYARLLG